MQSVWELCVCTLLRTLVFQGLARSAWQKSERTQTPHVWIPFYRTMKHVSNIGIKCNNAFLMFHWQEEAEECRVFNSFGSFYPAATRMVCCFWRIEPLHWEFILLRSLFHLCVHEVVINLVCTSWRTPPSRFADCLGKLPRANKLFSASLRCRTDFLYINRVTSGCWFCLMRIVLRACGVGFEFVLGRPECIHIIKDGNSSWKVEGPLDGGASGVCAGATQGSRQANALMLRGSAASFSTTPTDRPSSPTAKSRTPNSGDALKHFSSNAHSSANRTAWQFLLFLNSCNDHNFVYLLRNNRKRLMG